MACPSFTATVFECSKSLVLDKISEDTLKTFHFPGYFSKDFRRHVKEFLDVLGRRMVACSSFTATKTAFPEDTLGTFSGYRNIFQLFLATSFLGFQKTR